MLTITDDKIYLTRGDTAKIAVTVNKADGSAYALDAEDKVIFRLAPDAGKPLVVEKECEIDLVNNKAVLSLDTDDTKECKFKVYRYEFELIRNADSGHYTFIVDKPFEIGRELEIYD